MYTKRGMQSISCHNWIQFFVSMYNDTMTNKNEFVIQLQAEVVNLS
jgi:hypothetical protein